MPERLAGAVVARVDPDTREVCIRFPGTPPQFLARLGRLAAYLAVQSDREFRDVGQAVLDAHGPWPADQGPA